MKVAIIGARGHLGRPSVHAALDAGHEVTASGRSAERIERDEVKPFVVKGGVTDPDDVATAVAGRPVPTSPRPADG